MAAAGLAAGLAYDLRLKGTRWSWVPYAVGIPLLPVFAWIGATGTLPAAFAVLVPIAMLAGAALAVANALADVERDPGAGTETIATSLGLVRARRIGAVLRGLVVAAALGSAVAFGGDVAWIAVAAAGSADRRGRDRARLERTARRPAPGLGGPGSRRRDRCRRLDRRARRGRPPGGVGEARRPRRFVRRAGRPARARDQSPRPRTTVIDVLQGQLRDRQVLREVLAVGRVRVAGELRAAEDRQELPEGLLELRLRD